MMWHQGTRKFALLIDAKWPKNGVRHSIGIGTKNVPMPTDVCPKGMAVSSVERKESNVWMERAGKPIASSGHGILFFSRQSHYHFRHPRQQHYALLGAPQIRTRQRLFGSRGHPPTQKWPMRANPIAFVVHVSPHSKLTPLPCPVLAGHFRMPFFWSQFLTPLPFFVVRSVGNSCSFQQRKAHSPQNIPSLKGPPNLKCENCSLPCSTHALLAQKRRPQTKSNSVARPNLPLGRLSTPVSAQFPLPRGPAQRRQPKRRQHSCLCLPCCLLPTRPTNAWGTLLGERLAGRTQATPWPSGVICPPPAHGHSIWGLTAAAGQFPSSHFIAASRPSPESPGHSPK